MKKALIQSVTAAEPAGIPDLDPVDARLIDRLHSGFPLVERPFTVVAAELGMPENELLERLRALLSQDRLRHFGPLFELGQAVGSRALAAMQVPEQRIDAVSERVDALPEVERSYRGAPPFNLWLAIGVESPHDIEQAIAHIEHETGLSASVFPQQREYPVEPRLPGADQHGAE